MDSGLEKTMTKVDDSSSTGHGSEGSELSIGREMEEDLSAGLTAEDTRSLPGRPGPSLLCRHLVFQSDCRDF